MPSLNDLPAEIIYAILPYTEPDLNPALSIYPLNALAATSRRLRDIVEEHARRQLKKHRNIIPPTMTEALRTTGLSKQDLFTPSELHPNLPPLRTGLYPIYGGTATTLSTPDVLARKAYIKSLPRRRNKRPATGVPPGLEKRARQT
ncbi:hypothetical protein A1F97_09550 [Pyrenophora tritici-repentis]|nr:hypothetical protein PtrEW7m1_011361 [Pyrenophora tritici-repentis]PWO21207.1 eisosome protein 1 protein [Pyrenophora tritici-repentis]PZD24300.1 hypothetical protein A1F96_09469 [Pyrenophora tritici-repentis]PZD32501.1 hypothetical protein A1F97_09550 [Pyrenophora tritici-repentis]